MPHSPFSLLETALEHLPNRETAFSLIEPSDLRPLSQRVLAAEYLAREDTPLCRLDDLRAHLERFCEHLQRNRTALVQTGLPSRVYTARPWLHRQLGRLYHVRRTSSPYPRGTMAIPLTVPEVRKRVVGLVWQGLSPAERASAWSEWRRQ